jgi:hypothetical protein
MLNQIIPNAGRELIKNNFISAMQTLNIWIMSIKVSW